VIALLRIPEETDHLDQEARARLHAAEAALARIDGLAREPWTRDDSIERLRGMFTYRQRRFAARFDEDEDDDAYEQRSSDYTRMMVALIESQREAIERLRIEGEISDDVMRRVEKDLDLEETRLTDQPR